MVLAYYVWTYWIGVVLVIGAVLAVIGLVIGYVVKVEIPRYPRQGQEVARVPEKKA